MQITIPRGALLPALAQAARVAASSSTIPLLAHVLLRTDAGGITLTASDTEISTTIALEAKVDTLGDCALEAKLLHDYVKRLPEKAEITIACDQGSAEATVKAGRARTKMLALLGADFPAMPAIEAATTFSIDAGEFARLLSVTAPAVSTEEGRYYLCGHYLHALEGKLRAVATNGHALAMTETVAPEGAAAMPGVILTSKFAGQALALAATHKGEFRISVNETRIELTAGAVELKSKLIDGTFPAYERVIPRDPPRIALVDAGELLATVGRVSLFTARDKSRHGTVNLAFEPDAVKVWCKSHESGTSEETLEIEFEGDPLSIAFSDRYLGDLVKAAAAGADTVQMCLTDPGSPLLLRAKPDAPELFVIMPRRGD